MTQEDEMYVRLVTDKSKDVIIFLRGEIYREVAPTIKERSVVTLLVTECLGGWELGFLGNLAQLKLCKSFVAGYHAGLWVAINS